MLLLYLLTYLVFGMEISLVIINDSNEKYNQTIGFSLDTQKYVTKGDLFSNCSNLEISTENGEFLEYFIESGCNTNSSFIFVKIPVVSTNRTELNVTSTDHSSEFQKYFNGEVLLLFDEECPSGYPAYNPVEFGANLYVSDTDVRTDSGTSLHTHYIEGTVSETTDAQYVTVWDQSNLVYACTNDHVHDFNFNLLYDEAKLPSVKLNLCRGKLKYFDNFIGIFSKEMSVSSYSSPLFAGKYILVGGDASPGDLKNEIAHSHSNNRTNQKDSIDMSYCSEENQIENIEGDNKECMSIKHNHKEKGIYYDTEKGDNYPLSLNVILARKKESYTNFFQEDDINLVLLTLNQSNIPPLGYTLDYGFEGKFLIASTIADAGKISGNESHRHEIVNMRIIGNWENVKVISEAGYGEDLGSGTSTVDIHIHPFPSPLFSDEVSNFELYNRTSVHMLRRVWDNEYTIIVNYAVCNPSCGEHQYCNTDNQCKCLSDYTGENCDKPVCIPQCGNNSRCVAPYQCECEEKWTGESPFTDCNDPFCEQECLVNSFCFSYNTCKCKEYWNGEYPYTNCSIPIWDCTGEYECKNNSVCVSQNQCECDDGWYGDSYDCPIPICYLTQCGINSKCIAPDTCECIDGYESESSDKTYCRIPICSQGCYHGSCADVDTCKCDDGYTGDDCDTIEDDDDDSKVENLTIYLIIGIGTGVIVFLIVLGLVVAIILVLVIYICIKQKQKNGFKELELDETETCNVEIQINQKLFEVDTDEVKLESRIGSGGGNAEIFVASWRKNKVAYKLFNTKELFLTQNQESFNAVEREISIVSSISHPNIIRFFGATISPPKIGILMEYCEDGDLMEWLLSKDRKIKTPKNIITIFRGIASGIEFIHSRKIIHRDIKPSNVLLKDLTPKLIDFGISRGLNSIENLKTRGVGTSYFMAPEIISSGKYTESVDIFSFAILCYCTIVGKANPYNGEDGDAIVLRVANNPDMRPICGIEFDKYDWIVDYLKKGWSHDPSVRSSAKDFFDLFCEKLEKME